jgi:hypothetical protein
VILIISAIKIKIYVFQESGAHVKNLTYVTMKLASALMIARPRGVHTHIAVLMIGVASKPVNLSGNVRLGGRSALKAFVSPFAFMTVTVEQDTAASTASAEEYALEWVPVRKATIATVN